MSSQATEPLDDKKYRPIPGGASILNRLEPGMYGVGTVALFARSTKKGDDPSYVYIFTNAHVLPNIGGPVLRGFEKVATATQKVNSEQVDGGIAKMDDPEQADLLNIIDTSISGKRHQFIIATLD